MKWLCLSAAALAAIPSALPAQTDNWRSVATAADERRIERLGNAWKAGLGEAGARNRRDLTRLGALVRPSAALARPHPAPGDYRCRTIKLGAKGAAMVPGFIAYGYFRCRVDLSPGGDLTLTKVTGSQRQMGKLYPNGPRQLVFLGTMALSSSERTWPTYGRDAERDVAGVFERVGTHRYRLVMPAPAWESELDILELIGPPQRIRR